MRLVVCLLAPCLLVLTGCAGKPIFSYGLSAAPNVSDRSYVAVARRPVVRPHAHALRAIDQDAYVAKSPDGDVTEDAFDRSVRQMNSEYERIESAARRATASICRGC